MSGMRKLGGLSLVGTNTLCIIYVLDSYFHVLRLELKQVQKLWDKERINILRLGEQGN